MDYLYLSFLFVLWKSSETFGTIIVPPWGDPKLNPCASKPNGWQLLYWPADDECYRIFQKGYPCSESMELTPGKGGLAECQCPPGTAQSPRDAICHKLFTRGPCSESEYFAPVANDPRSVQRHRWGACVEAENCSYDKVYWPKDGKCYEQTIRGPCPDGMLLRQNGSLGECACDRDGMALHYWEASTTCYEHFVQGPCENGQIFLPGGSCGCDSSLKQYYDEDGMCYALNTTGPCKGGHKYVLAQQDDNPENDRAVCVCKEGYIKYEKDGQCYRPFTRGPCGQGNMLEYNYEDEQMTCVQLPCSPGYLYFPGGKGCHKVGTQGPCPEGQVVLFQETKEKSVSGLSYLGLCGCPNHQSANTFFPTLRADTSSENVKCLSTRKLDTDVNETNQTSTEATPETTIRVTTEDPCSSKRGMVMWMDHACYPLYNQGPCKEGEWVVPDRGKGQRKGRGWKMGKCECRPGYAITTAENGTICQPPSVILAKFLNTNSHTRLDIEE